MVLPVFEKVRAEDCRGSPETAGPPREGVLTAKGKADLPEGGHVQLLLHDAVGAALQDQLGQDADAKAAFHHGHDGVVVQRHKAGPKGQVIVLKESSDLRLLTFFQKDEGVIQKGFVGELPLTGQWVALRENYHELILTERDGFQLDIPQQGEKAAVHPTAGDPVLYFGIVSQQDLKVDVGIGFLKFFDQVGQPVGGYAGKGADADKSRLKVADLLQLLLKGLIAVPQRLNIGKKLKPFGGEHYPVVVPLQKDYTPILLQIGHHAAYVGLGVMELPGGGGEAAVFHTVQKGQIFLQVGVSHGGSSFSGVNLPKGGEIY